MTEGDFAVSPRDARAPDWRADRLRARWPAVHIDRVDAEPYAGGRRVRAVIRLGQLTPADVIVGLTSAAAAEHGGADVTCPGDERMWSCESYDNGCFVFERVLPAATAADEWVVSVCPTDARAGRPVMYPLRAGGA